MKKFIAVVFTLVLSITGFSQKFNAMSLISKEKQDTLTEETIDELNIFNISMDDKIVVHNRIKTDGECSSQIYKLHSYQDSDTEGEFVLTIYFKSKLHDYELTIIENDDGTSIIGDGYVYTAEVFELKTYK